MADFHKADHPVFENDPLTSTTRPLTSSTLTIRFIKSFEYRTMKALVLQEVDLTKMTVGELMEECRRKMLVAPGFKPFRTTKFDTLKLYTQAHYHKTMNLIINLDHDDWFLDDPERTLSSYGAANETEYSFFNREAYEAYKVHPEVKWD